MRVGLLGGVFAAAALSLAVYLAPGSSLDPASAQDVVYFRIGAGTPGSTYYGIAGRIAGTISNPPGSRACDDEGACGVEGLLGLAQTTMNPIVSLESLRGGSLEAALVSADIADAALRGTGPFKEAGAMEDLRAIANVSSLMLQIVVPVDSKATDVKGLNGKKIAIGVQDSDSAITTRFLLRAAGLNDKKAKLITGGLETVAQDLTDGKIDALAVVEQLPSAEIAALLTTGGYRLLPAEIVAENAPAYIISDWIDSSGYDGVASIRTIGVPVVLAARADLPGQIAGGLVRALWHSALPGVLDMPNGSTLSMMSRASVPWHPSAAEAFQQLSKTEPATPPALPPTN